MNVHHIGADGDPTTRSIRGRLGHFFQGRAEGRSTLINRQVLRDFQPHALAIEETPPSPFTRLILWLLVSLFLAALAWSWFSRIPIMTTAPGRFTTEAHTKVVQSVNAGTVANVYVKSGDTVRKGQLLAVLDSSVDRSKEASAVQDLAFNDLQQRRISTEVNQQSASKPPEGITAAMLAVEVRLQSSQLETQRRKLAVDDALIREATANHAAAEATLHGYVERASKDVEMANDASPLVAQGALSGQAFVQLEDQAIVDEGQVQTQREQLDELTAGIIAAKQQRALDVRTFESDRLQDLESAVGRTYDLSAQYSQAQYGAESDELRAPVDGKVQSVDVSRLGSVVQVGQTVATLVPSDAPLVMEVDVPSSDIGFVRVGERTQIKVTAYPFEEYGSLPGHVVSISPTADATSDLSSLPEGDSHAPPNAPTPNSSATSSEQGSGASPPTLFYRVRVQPDAVWLNAEGQRQSMRSGMTATVDIETGERRVLNFFLDPIIRYVRTGTGVR